MSLILDALRRADAQRERDPSRGIHAQSAPLPGDEDDPAPFIDRLPLSRRLLPWAGGLVLLLAALVGWREVREDPDTQAQARTRSHSLPPLPDSTGPRPGGPAPAILPAPAVTTPAPTRPAAPAPGRAGTVRATPVASSASAAPGTPAASAVRRAGVSLPPPLAALAISGSVYASSPQQRLLIVNGHVHGEGAEPVPGVRVEQIRPNAAVLGYRGQRYEVGF